MSEINFLTRVNTSYSNCCYNLRRGYLRRKEHRIHWMCLKGMGLACINCIFRGGLWIQNMANGEVTKTRGTREPALHTWCITVIELFIMIELEYVKCWSHSTNTWTQQTLGKSLIQSWILMHCISIPDSYGDYWKFPNCSLC
jgi:hypothetical protein